MLLLKGTSEQAVIEKINGANSLPVQLNVGDLYFGVPKTIADGYVSVPTVTQFNNSDYSGYQSFEYKRIDLSKVFGTIRPVLKVSKVDSLAKLLPIVNKTLGLSLSIQDIVDQSLTWGSIGTQQNLQFTAAPGSLGYQGRFVVQCILTRPMLLDSVKQSVLDALKHPDPVSSKKSISMMTWGLDFTDDYQFLSIVQGRWRFPEQLALMMKNRGFDNYPQAETWTLGVRPTKDVPRSNKEYTHVIVHPNVNTATYQGSGYFHFNLK